MRANIRFFPTPVAAEAAGFRACLRCRPNSADPHRQAVEQAVEKVVRRIAELDGEALSLEQLAREAGLDRFVLLRAFRRTLGVTPAEFARQQRRERFRAELRSPGASITGAVYAAGFGSSSRLYESAPATLGMKPTALKSGGRGETIRWSTASCPLGRVLVASTEQGLCCVLFADSDEDAERELRERFTQAELQRDDATLGEAVRFVLDAMSEHPSAASLPLDVRATAFQHRVWQALREIPRGETRTYGEIARSIGAPKAVRAVGAACGANPLAVVVPCHRAVGASGSLTGYRWGVERKRKLLALEAGNAGETSASLSPRKRSSRTPH